MGGIITKAGEWTEVVTGSSPGSPESDDPHRITNNEVARRRILRVDPRSISDDVNRTPIQVDQYIFLLDLSKMAKVTYIQIIHV